MAHFTDGDLLLGLSFILLSMQYEQDPFKRGAYKFVLEGALEKFGIAEREVRQYLRENREKIEKLWREKMRAFSRH